MEGGQLLKKRFKGFFTPVLCLTKPKKSHYKNGMRRGGFLWWKGREFYESPKSMNGTAVTLKNWVVRLGETVTTILRFATTKQVCKTWMYVGISRVMVLWYLSPHTHCACAKTPTQLTHCAWVFLFSFFKILSPTCHQHFLTKVFITKSNQTFAS